MKLIVFVLNNKMKIFLVIAIATIINGIGMYIVNQKFSDYFKYEFNSNLLITEVNETTASMKGSYITDYNQFALQDLEQNIMGIDLANLQFIKDNSQSMRRYIQDNLNQGIKAQNQKLVEMYDADLFNENNINIPLPLLDVDHVIIGEFPATNEAMISENFATQIINESNEINDYKNLIGTAKYGYTISGIYKSSNKTEVDEIIVSSEEVTESENKLLLIKDYSEQQLEQLEQSQIPYITYKNFKRINYAVVIELVILFFTLFITYFSLKKEIAIFKFLCEQNKVRKVVTTVNVISPFILIIILKEMLKIFL